MLEPVGCCKLSGVPICQVLHPVRCFNLSGASKCQVLQPVRCCKLSSASTCQLRSVSGCCGQWFSGSAGHFFFAYLMACRLWCSRPINFLLDVCSLNQNASYCGYHLSSGPVFVPTLRSTAWCWLLYTLISMLLAKLVYYVIDLTTQCCISHIA